MADDKKDSSGDIMDVSKPGKSAPDASARPVLVSRRPMVQDPMVAAKPSPVTEIEPTDGKAKEPEDKPASRTGMTIEPSEQIKVEVNQKTAEEAKEPTPAKETAKTDDKAPETPVTGASDEAAVNAVAGEAETKKEEQKISDEEKARQEAVAKLVESKQYFVPISKPKNQSTMVVTVVVVLLVLAIGLELAIDAGLIDIGIPPIVDLIKN